MQQRGSKYDQKIKDEALALVASGVSITNAACRLRIPKSTLADWVHTQNESDEDGVAARREIRQADRPVREDRGQGAACARPQG